MRRGRSREKRVVESFHQAPYRQPQNPYQPMAIFSDDEIESIHNASLQVLRDTGMNIQSPRAVEILRAAGANIDADGQRVRFDPDFIMEKISTTPSSFTMHGRTPDKHLDIGGKSMIFSLVSSAPNVSNLDKGRVATRPLSRLDTFGALETREKIIDFPPISRCLSGVLPCIVNELGVVDIFSMIKSGSKRTRWPSASMFAPAALRISTALGD